MDSSPAILQSHGAQEYTGEPDRFAARSPSSSGKPHRDLKEPPRARPARPPLFHHKMQMTLIWQAPQSDRRRTRSNFRGWRPVWGPGQGTMFEGARGREVLLKPRSALLGGRWKGKAPSSGNNIQRLILPQHTEDFHDFWCIYHFRFSCNFLFFSQSLKL